MPVRWGRAAAALTVLVVAAVALSVAQVLAVRASGVMFWGTSPVVVASLATTALASTALGWRVRRRGDSVVGGWLLATAGALLAYLVALAAMIRLVLLEGWQGPAAGWLALAALGGHVMPFVLIQASLLAARDRLAAVPGRGRRFTGLLLAVGAANLIVGAASFEADPPLDGVRPPLGGTWLAAATATPGVWTAAYVGWLLSALAGPVALWRAGGRATGMARRRLSIAAVVSLLPASTIACCVLLLPALMVADLPEQVAVDVLMAFFGAAFPLTAAGLAVATGGRDDDLRLRSRALKIAVHSSVGLVFALLAVTVSALVAVAVADGATSVAVVTTAVVVGALWPLRRRLARRLLLRADPRLAVAASLAAQAGVGGSDHLAAAARQVLRAALEDPVLEVSVRLPGSAGWLSAEGRPLPPPEEQSGGQVTVLPDADGAPHVYVLHATTTEDAAGTIGEVRPLLDRAALEVAVRHQAEQLAQERARADRAAAEERRRLERDLHDGVQGRLLAVALDLQAAGGVTSAGETHLALRDAVASLRTAIEEVRRLGSGAAQEVLGRGGLCPALDDLARRMPVPVQVSAPVGRVDPGTETMAYLVVSEAVTNAVKHGGTCSVDVSVRLDGDSLSIRVADDGPGGADVRAGTGLRGVAERVHAAGGSFVVSDRRPHGTLLEVVLPCAR